MARLGFVDQEGNVSHISSSTSYTPTKKKKKKDEDITTIKTNNETQDIRTVKTEDTKKPNLIDKAKVVAEGGISGLASGLTGVADTPMQGAREQLQKGEKNKTKGDMLKDAAVGIMRASSPVLNAILKNKETSEAIKKTFKDKDKNTLQKVVNSGLVGVGNSGIDNTYEGINTALRGAGALNNNLDEQVANLQAKIDKPSQDYQQKVSQRAQEIGGLTNTLTNVSQQIGNMGPSIAATAITKNPSARLALMGVSAKGQSTNEALQNGADLETANRIGTAKGLTEVGTELMTGGAKIFGKGTLDDIATNFIDKKIGKAGLNWIAKQGLGVVGEIGEEIASDLIGTLIDRGTIDPNANYSPQDLLNTIKSTSLTTLALNGLTGGYTPKAYRQNAIELQESRGNNGNISNNNDNVVPNSNQVREVNEIQQKAQNGEITYEQANQQLEQVQNGTYQQNQNLEAIASQEVQRIQQAVETGQMDPSEATQEIQAITNTLQSERERINTPQQEVQQEVQEETQQEAQETKEEPIQEKKSPTDLLNEKEKQKLQSIYKKQASGEVLSKEDKATLDKFRNRQKSNQEIEQRKEQGLKNPELTKPKTYQDVRKDYGKYYSNADMENFDTKIANKAAETIAKGRYGRTKQQWYDLAKNIGMQAENMDSESLKKYAFASYKYFDPNAKGNINKQSNKKNYTQIHEWVNAVYEGARVGEKATQTETKQTKTEKQIENFKERGTRVLDKVPEGYIKVEGATTAPNGYTWYSNGKSMFKGERESVLVKDNVEAQEQAPQKTTQEPSLKNAKNYYNRNLGKYTPGDAFESAIGEYQLRPEEAENLRDYTIKKYPDYADEINRRYNDLYQEEQTKQEIKEEPIQQEQVEQPKEEPKVQKTDEELMQDRIDKGMSEKGAKILNEMPKPDKLSVRERIKQKKAKAREEWAYFKRNVVDKGEAVYTLAKKTKNRLLYAKYDKRGTTTGEANYDIEKGQTNLNGKKFNNFKIRNEKGELTKKTGPMSLNQLWEQEDNLLKDRLKNENKNITKQELEDKLKTIKNEYLAEQLNVDRFQQTSKKGRELIAELEAQVKAKKITAQEMQEELKNYNTTKYVFSPEHTDVMSKQRVAELEKAYPELKTFGENVWQYGRNQLQNMVDAGMVSQEQANKWNKETPHYVRLQRNVPQNSTSMIEYDDKGNAKVNKQVKEFEGSELDILPFKETMAQYTLDVRNSIRDNIFAEELANTLGMSDIGEVAEDMDDLLGANPNLLNDNGDGSYTLTFYNKGVPTNIPIDQGIYEALQPNKHYEIEDKFVPKTFRKIDTVRKALLTDKNPLFLATNMMKDVFDAPLNSKYPLAFAKNYPRAFNEIVLKRGKGSNYQQYQALGGLQNTYFENGEFSKKGSKLNPLNWIEKANNAIEQLPRLAEFMSTMEKTGNIDEAMYNAAEITTNFKRGGDVAKALNRNGITFLNASIQGFDKQVRNFKEIQNPRQAVQMLGKAVVLGIAPALLNDWAFDDDEDYQDLQEYIKDNYYLLGKTKNGTWIRIPKGRAVSVFQSAARRTKYAIKGDEKAYDGFVRQVSNQIAPNNPFENNIISPWLDVLANVSWSGNPIVSEYKKNDTYVDVESDIKTDKFSQWLSKEINKNPLAKKLPARLRSPKGISYIIDQYSGIIGDVALPLGTDYAESKSDNKMYQAFVNPIISKFSTNTTTSSKSQNEFYDALSKANDANDTRRKDRTVQDQAVYKYLDSKSGDISKIREKITELQESNKSNREKFEKTLDYTKQINDIAKEATKTSKNVETNKNEIKIGDSLFAVANGEVTKVKQETIDKAKEYGLSVGDYTDITAFKGKARADLREDGTTIRGSAKQKVINYVYSKEDLSEAKKKEIIEKLYSR